MNVIYPGTFDPPTNGHLNILQRASGMFEKVDVVIAVNPGKESLFTPDERFAMVDTLAGDFPNVDVHLWSGLIVDFARQLGTHVLVRGVRALDDFAYEFELSMMNRALNQVIETLFLPTHPDYFVLRSSGIKEVARFHGDVSEMVPAIVAEALRIKFPVDNP